MGVEAMPVLTSDSVSRFRDQVRKTVVFVEID